MKKKIYQSIASAAFILSLLIPAGMLTAQDQQIITLYGSELCGFCQAMKRNLDAEKIPYTFYDVNKDKTKNSEMWTKVGKAFPAGVRSVTFPVMDINGKILISPKFEEVKSLLASGREEQKTDDSSAAEIKKQDDHAVIPDQAEDTKIQDLQGMKKTSVIFQNRYYKNNVWDAQRIPSFPAAGRDWKLMGFKVPFDSKTRSSIDWGRAGDRYLAFDVEIDEKNNSVSLIDDLFNSGKKYRVVLNLFENNGKKVKTVSDWGKLSGPGSEGFMYVQQGFYGTMFTNSIYKENNSLTYRPDLGTVTKLSELANYSYKPGDQKR